MIHGVSANQSTFRSVCFEPGLNVVIAERSDTSTKKDTRNSIGKSTLIEIVSFCLGAEAKPNKGLIIDDLKEWSFTLDLTIAGKRVRATRAIKTPGRIIIEGDTAGWIDQPEFEAKNEERLFPLDRWKLLLGWAMFGLPHTNDSSKYKPTYRSLISYFIRRTPDAYSSPFRHFRNPKRWQTEVEIAYLLGLNWEHAMRWQQIRDQEEALKALAKALKSGTLEGIVGSVGDLEAQRVQLESKTNSNRVALDTFKVHPQYEEIQLEADHLTAEIHELTNQNVTDRRRLSLYSNAITEEVAPNPTDLEKLYKEVGLVFPQDLRRTLAEAKEFHHDIIKNRREFLQVEMSRLERRIKERSNEIIEKTELRANSLSVLETHGALREFSSLEARFLSTKAALENVLNRLSQVKEIDKKTGDVKVEKIDLTSLAKRDYEERRERWATAVRLFNDNSQALYNTAGKLVINITDSGYSFDVDIQGDSLGGIGKMKIFCFDLMLAQLWSKPNRSIDFLIHDSIIFEGVDSRQIALALEQAHRTTQFLGTQYICTLNSDIVPRNDFSPDFNFDNFVRLKLTDQNAAGSLLGIRFQGTKAERHSK